MPGYHFSAALKFLSLPVFDLVVGMDWLHRYSPMHVDWTNKWMTIPYKGTTKCLQGLRSSLPVGTVVELLLLLSDTSTSVPSARNSLPKIDPWV